MHLSVLAAALLLASPAFAQTGADLPLAPRLAGDCAAQSAQVQAYRAELNKAVKGRTQTCLRSAAIYELATLELRQLSNCAKPGEAAEAYSRAATNLRGGMEAWETAACASTYGSRLPVVDALSRPALPSTNMASGFGNR